MSNTKIDPKDMSSKIAGVMAVLESGLATDDKAQAGMCMEHAVMLQELVKHLGHKMPPNMLEHFSHTAVIFGGLALVHSAKEDPIASMMLDAIKEANASRRKK